MAPQQPKPKSDDISTTPSPLKPKTGKSKVEKFKSDKPKIEKSRAAAVKEEKIEKPAKPKVAKAAADKEEKPTKTAIKKEKVADKDGGKEKVKPVNGDEAIALISKYLKSQNRPYSATEVSANLHGKVTKTVADKLMKEMEQNGLIMAKATNGTNKGSQWVFWATQNPADAATPEELSAMDTSITAFRESLPALKCSLKILSTKLYTLKSAPTTTELVSIVENLRVENKMKEENLREFKQGSVKMITKEEMDKVEREFKYWGTRRRARKNAYRNLEAQLLVGMSKDEIEEKVGVEPDTYDV